MQVCACYIQKSESVHFLPFSLVELQLFPGMHWLWISSVFQSLTLSLIHNTGESVGYPEFGF